ncbi:MAG: nuclear transport factor 2 family protein, partial [Dehalococcoidia bacterium]|nr:nuclear transport factor 2 family protein [Dehalococcoidia bacterium]
MNPQRKYAILDRFFGAVEAGDIETAAEIYAPNVGIWHNFDGVTQSREESLRTLRWMCKKLAGRCYEE